MQLCGFLFGLAFGLTGLGSIFAVPLLVYVAGLPPHRAICVAMLAVAVLSLIVTAWRWRHRTIDIEASWIVALTGLVAAPLGAWSSRFLSGHGLMLLFAGVILVVAIRILFLGSEEAGHASVRSGSKANQRIVLAGAGLISGILAGLLGIGGVVVIPALIISTGMPIQRAIGTSQAALLWVGLSAFSSHLISGQRIPFIMTCLFVVGSAAGMAAGTTLAGGLAGRAMEIIFGLAVLGVAILIVIRPL